jgi:hypothetical protein
MSPTTPRSLRVASTLFVLVVVATLLSPALGAGASKKPKSTTTTTIKHSLECTSAQLSFAGPGYLSPQTGEHGFTITLTNVSPTSCQVHGYPSLRFYTSAGRLLTFGLRHKSEYFRTTTPRIVTLASHAHAYFVVAKYRCDLRNRYVSTFFYILPLYTSGSPWVGHLSGNGVSQMDYCAGPSTGPGQILNVSPVVASLSELNP